MTLLNKGDLLLTPHVANLNLESERAGDIILTQDLPEETKESVINYGLVLDPILDINPVFDSVLDRVVDQASVPVSESNFQIPKLVNLNHLSQHRSSRTPKPSQRA